MNYSAFDGGAKTKKAAKKSVKKTPAKKKSTKKPVKKTTKRGGKKGGKFRSRNAIVDDDDYLTFVRNFQPQINPIPTKQTSVSKVSGKMGDVFVKQRNELFSRLDKEFGDRINVKMNMYTQHGDLDKLYREAGGRLLYVPDGDSNMSVIARGLVENGLVDKVTDPREIKEKFASVFSGLINGVAGADMDNFD